MLGLMRAAGFDPEVRVLVWGWILNPGEVERLAPLDTGAAAPAMNLAALVAGPGFGKGHTEPCALAYDVGFAQPHEGCVQGDGRQSLQSMALHRLERLNEVRAAIRVDEVVAAMDGRRDGIGLLGGGDTEGNREH